MTLTGGNRSNSSLNFSKNNFKPKPNPVRSQSYQQNVPLPSNSSYGIPKSNFNYPQTKRPSPKAVPSYAQKRIPVNTTFSPRHAPQYPSYPNYNFEASETE